MQNKPNNHAQNQFSSNGIVSPSLRIGWQWTQKRLKPIGTNPPDLILTEHPEVLTTSYQQTQTPT